MEHTDTKKYIAFISYKRDDEQAAAWLQEAIESFKLPTQLIAENHHLDKFQKRSVFRDKTDMSSGVLSDVIKRGLEQSHYLIVICSRAVVTSDWVNYEIRYFLSLHDENYKKIIPFIIDGIPKSKEHECLPTAIREIPKNKELLAINLNDAILNDDYKQIAAVKAISYMLEIDFKMLWDRHKIREEAEEQKRREEKYRYQKMESKYLCKIAEDYFEKEDYTQAYQAVLLALPSDLTDINDRPHVAEAERVLRRFLHKSISYPEVFDMPAPNNQWAISSDRKMVATADGISGKIRLWDAIDKSWIKDLPGYLGKLNTFEFCQNNTQLLIASNIHDVISLIDIESGRVDHCIRTIKPTFATLSYDGKHILSVSSYSTVNVWDIESKKFIGTLETKYLKKIIQVSLSDDGEYIQLTTEDKEKTIWHIKTQTKVHESLSNLWFRNPYHEHLNNYEASAYFRNPDKKLHILQRSGIEPCHLFRANTPVCIECSINGAIAASFNNPNEIAVWPSYTDSTYISLKGHSSHAFHIKFSHNGKMLVSIGHDNKVIIWNTENGECIEEIHQPGKNYDFEISGSPISAEFSTDNRFLLICYHKHCDLWDINARAYKSQTYFIDFFQKHIYLSEDNTVVIKSPIELDDDAWKISAISNDRQLMAVMTKDELKIYNLNDGNIISNKKYDCTDMEYLKFSSDSNYIIASGNTKHYSTKPNMSYIVIWNINKEDPIQIIEEESLNIQHANICTHNKILYASAEDAIFIWEHKPLQELINDLRSKYLIADNG